MHESPAMEEPSPGISVLGVAGAKTIASKEINVTNNIDTTVSSEIINQISSTVQVATASGINSAKITVGRDVNVINNINVNASGSTINQHSSSIQVPIVGVYGCDDLEQKLYVGQDEFLEQIEQWMQKLPNSVEENAVSFHTLVIHGMPGVGKTTIARRLTKNVSFPNIIWISAETEDSMAAAFNDLAVRKLQIQSAIDGRAKQVEQIVDDVYSKLLHYKTLLVLDNAECFNRWQDEGAASFKIYDGVAKFMPKMVKTPLIYPKILITSRNCDWSPLTPDLVCIQNLSKEACRIYITKKLSRVNDTTERWEELADYFGYLIIALESAVDAILFQSELLEAIQENYTIQEFLTAAKNRESAPTQDVTPSLDHIDDGEPVISLTYQRLESLWESTLLMLESNNQMALHILDTLAFMSPSGVPLELMNEIYRFSHPNRYTRLIAMKILQTLSLISKTITPPSFRIHRLLQQARIKAVTQSGKLQERLKEFSQAYSNTLSMISVKRQDNYMYVDNAIVVYNRIKSLQSNIEHVSLMVEIPVSLKGFNRHFTRDALTFLDSFLERKGINQSNEIRQKVTDNLVEILIYHGEYAEALGKVDDVLTARREILGEVHLSTVAALELKAHILRAEEKADLAFPIYEQVLIIKSTQLGINHLETWKTQHCIAQIFTHQGRYREALEKFEQVYAYRLDQLGAHHRDTTATQNNVAFILAKLGKHDTALEVYKQLHDVLGETQGIYHSDTLLNKNNIGAELIALGRYELALRTLQEVHGDALEHRGEDHPLTLASLHNIARIYQRQEKFSEALEVLGQVLTSKCRRFGERHPISMLTKRKIAEIYQTQGKLHLAQPIFQEVLSVQRAILGRDHPVTLITRRFIAEVLQVQGQRDAAVEEFQEILRLQCEKLGAEHPDTQSTMKLLHVATASKSDTVSGNGTLKRKREEDYSENGIPRRPEFEERLESLP